MHSHRPTGGRPDASVPLRSLQDRREVGSEDLAALGDLIRRLARKVRPGLRDDLYDDVVQEAYEGLLRARCPYEPARGAVTTYLYPFVRGAARAVAAATAPPGRRTRDAWTAPDDAGDERAEAIPTEDGAPAGVEQAAEVGVVLRRVGWFCGSAPDRAPLRQAVELLRRGEVTTWADAAARVGVSRDRLGRLRRAFVRAAN